MDYEKKLRHELFVSNRTGSSVFKIYSLWLTYCFVFHLRVSYYLQNKKRLQILADAILLYLPIFYVTPPFYHKGTTILVFVFIISLINIYFNLPHHQNSANLLKDASRLSSLLILICTVFGIFAVDLPLFPKDLAKVENFGISHFDIFVGLFIAKTGFSSSLSERNKDGRHFLFKLFIPNIVLAITRTFVVAKTGYQNHETEYGLHWNFFYTFSFIRLFSCICNSLLGKFDLLFALFLTSTQYFILSENGLNLELLLNPSIEGSWLNATDARQNSILLANSEGLTSFAGFMAIFYWASFYASTLKFFQNTPLLCLLSQGIFLILFTVPSLLFEPNKYCRRLVNVPFIIFTISIWTLIYLIVYTSLLLGPGIDCISKTVMVLSDYGFIFFLIGNLLTGLINISIDTLTLEEYYWTQLSLLLTYFSTCILMSNSGSGVVRGKVKISVGSLVCNSCELKGDITIGQRTVIHPKARVIAEAGPIRIGESNIIEERAEIINNEPDHTLIIGDYNVFEMGSKCEAIEVGNNNVFEPKSHVGPKVRVSNGVTIGTMVKINAEPEPMPNNLVIYGSEGFRRVASELPPTQSLQIDYLSKYLHNYHHLLKPSKPSDSEIQS